MFGFLKKLFGGQECTDCQNLEEDNNSQESHSFPIEDPNTAAKVVESVPEVAIAQPTLNMNTSTESTVEVPVVEESVTPIEDIPVETETNTEVTAEVTSDEETTTV